MQFTLQWSFANFFSLPSHYRLDGSEVPERFQGIHHCVQSGSRWTAEYFIFKYKIGDWDNTPCGCFDEFTRRSIFLVKQGMDLWMLWMQGKFISWSYDPVLNYLLFSSLSHETIEKSTDVSIWEEEIQRVVMWYGISITHATFFRVNRILCYCVWCIKYKGLIHVKFPQWWSSI